VVILHLTEKGWEHPDGATNAFRELGGDGGRTVEVTGLLPGHTYAAWMTPVAGEYVYVEFSADVGNLKLERARGRTLRGQVLNRPPDSSRVRIDARDSRSRWVRTRSPDPAGGFQIDGLPESSWTVRAWCRSADDVIWIAKEEVATGERLELRLAPQPKAEDE
jgi:hypothetical protein